MSGMPSMVKKRLIEIQRSDKGETVARIILGDNKSNTQLEFKSVYFSLNNLRR